MMNNQVPPPISHVDVDLEQVVKPISDLVGADYSAKYSVSGFTEYNAEQYVPSPSMNHEGEGDNQERQRAGPNSTRHEPCIYFVYLVFSGMFCVVANCELSQARWVRMDDGLL
jgi:hypothetical protein